MRSPEQIGQTQETSPAEKEQTLTKLQEHFLAKLHQLIAKREQQQQVDAKDKLSLRLLSRGLYSTYMDCVASGVGDQASDALEKSQTKEQPEVAPKAV